MTHTVTVRDGVYHVHIAAPTRVTALEMGPERLEAKLADGAWLVLGFAVWSGPDRAAIDALCDLGSTLSEQVALGVRPFEDHREFDRWCPLRPATTGSPIWLVLQDGHMVAQRQGTLARDDLAAWVRRTHTAQRRTRTDETESAD